MFCRKCGKTLLDGDRFCGYCGAQVIERNESKDTDECVEEVIYNDETTSSLLTEGIIENNDIQENLVQTQNENKGRNLNGQPKPNWNLEGFPTSGEEHRKTEDIKVDWKNQDLLRFETKQEQNKEVEKVSKSEVELEPEIKSETKMDIFELFDKQQEENKEPEVKQSYIDPTLEQELFGAKNNKSDKVHTFEEEQIDKFYTFSKKNEEFQKLLDKEYERLKQEPEFVAPEPKIPSNIEKLELSINENVHEEKTVESIVENTIEDNNKNEVEKNIQDNNNESVEKSEEDQNEEKLDENTLKHSEKDSKEEEVIDFSVLPWDENESQLGEFTDEDAGKKFSPMFIVLSIIIVLLAFEVAILGIKYFLPESSAAAFVNDKLGITVSWVDSLKNNNKEQEEQKKLENQEEIDKDKEQNSDQEVEEVNSMPQPNPEPNPDKNKLVEETLVYNTNIKSITVDDNLVYAENKDYRDKNINNSKKIENNIWYQDENGNTVYYDKEIVKTIIQFDSGWIDYVNKKDTTVLGLIKEDSSAYKNVKGFSKVGKVTKSFDSLKIGEIRQSENGFYVWTNEAITTTESGKSSTVNYKWIYYLEPIDKQMKIVSYKDDNH